MSRTIEIWDDKYKYKIEVPDEAKVTFGYFNPSRGDGGVFSSSPIHEKNVSRQTALRVYEGKTEKANQLACFMGVKGFRDESIELTVISQETNDSG